MAVLLADLLTDLLTVLLTDNHTYYQSYWLTYWQCYWLTISLTDCLIEWQTITLTVLLTDWLPNWLSYRWTAYHTNWRCYWLVSDGLIDRPCPIPPLWRTAKQSKRQPCYPFMVIILPLFYQLAWNQIFVYHFRRCGTTVLWKLNSSLTDSRTDFMTC